MPHRSSGPPPPVGSALPSDVNPLTEVLAAVFSARLPAHPRPAGLGAARLHLLLWQRARDPSRAGGRCRAVRSASARRSTPRWHANSRRRSTWTRWPTSSSSACSPTLDGCRAGGPSRWASSDWCRLGIDPVLPPDTAWHPVDALPPTAFDHGVIAARALDRLRAKLSYTNIAFALAPPEFTMNGLRRDLRRRARP